MARRTVTETLRLRVLGGFDVDGWSPADLGSRKARTVLKALALGRGAAVSVDRLAEIAWADAQPSKPADQVGVLVSRLRGVLGVDRITRTDAGYVLRYDWLDLEELERRVAEATSALGAERVAAARAAADAALALVRGEVLPEEDGDWIEADRAAAAALSLAARRAAAEAAALAGDDVAAATHADLALATDPCDEQSLRILMRAHVACGRPGSALSAYARTRERLAEDLGVSPTAATETLHDAIVLGEAPASDAGAEPRLVPGETPLLVGRAEELARLDTALTDVRGGRSQTVVVRGEGGIGKTALVSAWLTRLADDVVVFTTRCDELGRDLPLEPVVDALAAHLGGASAELAERVGDAAPVLAPLFVGTRPHGDHIDATTVVAPEIGRSSLFAALASALDRVAAGRVPVLFVDDIHLAGRSTVAWLTFVGRRVRLLVIAATRAEPEVGIAANVIIDLGPLSVEAVSELVGPARATDVHERSGGLPLLMNALVSDASPADLPRSVAEAVERRMTGLGPASITLRSAAAMGSVVDLDLLANVMNENAIDLLPQLEAASAAGVLEEVEGFRFRHELERVALEASLGATRRALVHREAARALAMRTRADPLAIALHARLGGEAELAIQSFVAAARASVARFDIDAAEQHLAAALAIDEDVVALVERARVRLAMGRLDDARADAERAIALSGDPAAIEVSGWIAYYERRQDDALALAEEALERAHDPNLRVSCLALAGRVLHASGEMQRAIERFTEAVAVDAPPEVRGVASIWLSQARAHEGKPVEALTIAARALVHPDRLAHPFAPLYGLFSRVLALGQLGRAGEALAACDLLDEAVTRAGAGAGGERMRAPALNCRGWILRWIGMPAAADECNERAVSASSPDGSRAEAYYAGMLDLVDGRFLEDDLDAVTRLLDGLTPIADWRGTMAWHQRHRWLLARARLALRVGDHEGAASLAGAAAADARNRGAGRYVALATALHALAAPSAFDTAALAATVDVLSSCAVIDGWPLVATLATTFDVAEWRSTAATMAEVVITSSPHAAETRAWVERVLSRT